MVCISEHWLNSGEINIYQLSNYRLINCFCRNDLRAGGVAIYALPNIVAKPRKSSISATEVEFEYTCAEIFLWNTRYIVICVYRSPSGDVNFFLQNLFDLLDNVSDGRNKVIVCGDFNINFKNNSNDAKATINMFAGFNLVPMVTEDTRVTADSSTLIDNVFVPSGSECSCTVGESLMSDHRYLSLKLTYNTRKINKSICQRRFSESAILEFQSRVAREDWRDVYVGSNGCDHAFQIFYNTFLYYFNICFPIRTFPIRCKSKNSWYNDDLKRMASQIRGIYDLYT